MHINQRIRIKTSEVESLLNFYQKVSTTKIVDCMR